MNFHQTIAPMPGGSGVATACAVLHAATTRLDAIRVDAERELIDHVRSRHDLEALIERLIAGLDAVDAADEDLEGHDAGGRGSQDLDFEIDVVDQPHDEHDQGDDEPSLGWTAIEAARGWSFQTGGDTEEDVADAPHDPEEDGNESDRWGGKLAMCSGIYASFKRGKLDAVRAIPRDGRARA